jgi:hypothetical protein
MRTSLRTAVTALALATLAFPAGAFAGLPTTCPSPSLAGSTLGLALKSPTVVHSKYFTMCTYAGGGAVPTRITFQMDTAATFAASEKAVSALSPVKVHGLGKAAWTLKSGGDLDVFTGAYTIKIVSPLTPSSKLEALARKLL